MFKLLLLLLVFKFYRLEVIGQNIKIWSKDLNLLENNQKMFRESCFKDRIIFPNNSLIFLNSSFKFKSIILPYNGQIVFGNNFKISYLKDDVDCITKDWFYKTKASYWFDPQNWNQIVNNQIISGEWPYNPVPHSDRVPCLLDQVIFPKSMSIQVYLDLPYDCVISSLRINDQELNDETFQNFINSFVGKLMFKTDFEYKLKIATSSQVCNIEKYCPCFNNNLLIFEKICSFIKTCPDLECNDPIKPVGYCCPICGAMVSIISKPGFNFKLLKSFFESYWTNDEYQGSLGYISQVSTQKVQAVITDKNGKKGVAKKFAQAFLEYLKEDQNHVQPNVFNLESINIKISDNWKADSWSGSILLILFLLLITICLVYAIFYFAQGDRFAALLRHHYLINFRSRVTNSQFVFVRFHGSEDGDKVEIETSPAVEEATESNLVSSSSFQPTDTRDISLLTISKESSSNVIDLFEMKNQERFSKLVTNDLQSLFENDKDVMLDMVNFQEDEE